MDFTSAIKSVFSKYATFTGRARRSEYWYFTLFSVIVTFLIMGISVISESIGSILYMVFCLGFILPSLAVNTRRLHDTGRSGWHIVILYVVEFAAIALLLAGLGLDVVINPERVDLSSIQIPMLAIGGILYLVGVIYSIVLFVFSLMDSQIGSNKYGPNPKGEEEIATNDNF